MIDEALTDERFLCVRLRGAGGFDGWKKQLGKIRKQKREEKK